MKISRCYGHINAFACRFTGARRGDASAAVSRVCGHRLHPDSGTVRDGVALVSAQIIRAGRKAAVLLLRSILLIGASPNSEG